MINKKNMWYVYVLESQKNNRLYVGYTNNIKRRIQDHNYKNGGSYTRKNCPYKLIFCEIFLNKYDATKQEKFYKSGYGKEILKDKLKNYFNNKHNGFKAPGSSNGRTIDSGSINLGSNPSPGALKPNK